jgi:hypothetical protein
VKRAGEPELVDAFERVVADLKIFAMPVSGHSPAVKSSRSDGEPARGGQIETPL